MTDLLQLSRIRDEITVDLDWSCRLVSRDTGIAWAARVVRLTEVLCELRSTHLFPSDAMGELTIQGSGAVPKRAIGVVRSWRRMRKDLYLIDAPFLFSLTCNEVAKLRSI